MVKRKDLVDIGDKNYNNRRGEFMYCPECDLIYGGTQGDFFMVAMEYEFRCQECKGELFLAREKTKIEIIN